MEYRRLYQLALLLRRHLLACIRFTRPALAFHAHAPPVGVLGWDRWLDRLRRHHRWRHWRGRCRHDGGRPYWLYRLHLLHRRWLLALAAFLETWRGRHGAKMAMATAGPG